MAPGPTICPFAINTYSYTLEWPILRCIEHLAARGVTALEVMMYPGHLWPADMSGTEVAAVRRALAGAGMRVLAVNMPNIDLNVAAASPQMRAYTLDMLAGFVRLGGEIGAASIIVGPGKANPLFPMQRDRLVGYFFAALERLFPVAESSGVKILVENMPFCFLSDARSIMRALDDFGNPEIGTIYDFANAHFIGEDLAQGLREMKPRLGLVHLSDTNRAQYRHAAVGQGDIPFTLIPPMLRDVGYDEMPVLEIIDADADGAIFASVDRLSALGFGSVGKR